MLVSLARRISPITRLRSGSYDLGNVAATYLRAILVESDIPHPMRPVADRLSAIFSVLSRRTYTHENSRHESGAGGNTRSMLLTTPMVVI